jgi:hypothetical protein
VAPVTADELSMYEGIHFDVDDYKKDVGTAKLVDDGDKVKTLMARDRCYKIFFFAFRFNFFTYCDQ